MIDHRRQLLDLEPVAEAGADIDDEHREPVAAALYLVGRRGAGQQQHQIGLQRARGPDFLAMHDVVIVPISVMVPLGTGLDLRRIGAGRGFGDAERLQPEFARRELRQDRLLLCLATVPQQRAHDVELRVAGGGIAARGVDLLEDRARGAQRQSCAAISLGNKRGEIAGFGERFDEGVGVFLPLVEARANRLPGKPSQICRTPARISG